MSTFLDKMNLRPQERRWVVAVSTGVFLLLNWYLVFPYFSEWGKVRAQMATAQETIIRYQTEIQNDCNPGGYQAQLKALDKQGATVQLEGDVQLFKTVQAQAFSSRVVVTSFNPATVNKGAQTNQFFEEQTMSITVDTEEKSLIDFMYAIGGDNSMIRVRDLTLRPADHNRFRLRGSLTLSANYQKKSEVKAAAATTSTNKPSATGRPTLVPAAKPPQAPGAPKPAK